MDISVLIPTYKPGTYLWECLDSLYAQTLPKNSFEVVVVLNGCDEPYQSMLDEGIGRYKGMLITVLKTKTLGVSNARNIALKHAFGRQICFLDDDDWVSETYLQDLFEKSEDGMVVCSNIRAFDETNGKVYDDYISSAFSKLMSCPQPLGCYNGRKFMSSACCKMIPRSLIDSHRFDTRFKLGEDSLFMFAVGAGVKGIKLSSPECIYYRRLRSLSASRKKRSVKDEMKNDIKLCFAYTAIWIRHARTLNFLFYLSRIAATFINMFTCVTRL